MPGYCYESCLAGIIVYNPDYEKLKRNVLTIIEQVNLLIVVDNGSYNTKTIDKIIDIVDKNTVKLIRNDTNLGVASALNQIFQYAKDNSFDWVLTLDQDSVADSKMVSSYSKTINDNKNIGIVCPQVIDTNMRDEIITGDGLVEVIRADEVITSGSLTNVQCWEAVGKYDERLFIDYVDTEFQERVIRSGKQILRNRSTYILHEVGRMKVYNFKLFKIYCTNHDASRRYFMVRNRLYYRRKYFGYIGYLKEKIRLMLGDIKMLVFEEQKVEKLKASFKGYRDYKKLLG